MQGSEYSRNLRDSLIHRSSSERLIVTGPQYNVIESFLTERLIVVVGAAMDAFVSTSTRLTSPQIDFQGCL